MDRKAELEAKRKRLEDLRRTREAKQFGAKSGTSTPVPETTDKDTRDSVNDLVASLLGDATPVAKPPQPPSSTSPVPQISSPDLDSRTSSHLDLSSVPSHPLSRPVVALTTSEVQQINIPPQERVVYEKGAQTDDWLLDDVIQASVNAQLKSKDAETETQTGTAETETVTEDVEQEEKQETAKPVVLEEEQARAVMESEGFLDFFMRTTKIIERALDEPYDIARDYTGGVDGDAQDSKLGREVTLLHAFSHDRYTKNRAVTSLDWSPKYPELFLSAFNQNEMSSSEPGGSVLVWNTHMKDRPEFVFHWQSPVTSACFAKFNPHLIVGGTYSGQIVLWDVRQKSAPVQRTTLSTSAHAHPVYGMAMTGTQNANNLVTVSTDGKMCSWLLDILAEPQDTLDLRKAATCLSFPDNDVNNFVVGGEDGFVHLGSRLNSNAGTLQLTTIPGAHAGPVTSVDCHPAAGEIDFSDYVLSSSTDWSIKLWSKSGKRLLHAFDDATDYVYCAKWSPIHPAVFASVDGSSRLCIWNITENTEVPVVAVQVSKKGTAVNQLHWSADGRRIICGDADGITYLYDVGELLAVPRPDAWNRLRETVRELAAAQHTVDGGDAYLR